MTTIKEKAKRYEQAFLMAKKLKETCDSNAVVGWMEYIFPELAESDDERIRKDIVTYLKSILSNKKYGDKFVEDWIAWLEKRGEQKKELLQELDNNLNNALENETSESLGKFLNEQKPVDKIQIGKKYKCIASPRYTTFMVGEIYKPEDRFLCSLMNFCSACFKPIEDDEQKPADLKTKAGNWYICDMEVINENMEAAFHRNESYYCPKDGYLDVSGALFKIGDLDVFRLATEKEIPQSKQEWSEEDSNVWNRTLLYLENIKDSCATACVPYINECMNWLKSLKDRVGCEANCTTTKKWSEEDEKMLNDILMCGEHHCYLDAGNIAWLKNLKDRVQPQNSSVTDEELARAKKEAYNEALDKIEYHSGEPTFDDGWSAAIWYLKKRNGKPQSHWKPSDEQMDMLARVCSTLHLTSGENEIMESIYDALWKLKG